MRLSALVLTETDAPGLSISGHFELARPHGCSCAGFWTPASRGAPAAPAAGVQKAPGHEVAGSLAALASGRRYGDLIFAPVMMVGAKLAPGDLDRVWRRATGIAGVAGSVPATGRFKRAASVGTLVLINPAPGCADVVIEGNAAIICRSGVALASPSEKHAGRRRPDTSM